MIKEIDKSNIAECVNVIRKSFQTVADEFGFTVENAPRFTAFATTEEWLFYQLEYEHRLMAAYFSDDGKIVGYYSLPFLENSECELNNLCVLPEFRHKKIGESLLADAVTRAKSKNCTKMKIGIVEENKVLRKWYEAHEFIHTHTQKYDFFPFTCGYMERDL
ncbi:MAG: GNAT family N-acetyltransferase [Spirochaetaceae bacterium]|nr:GNAT family N-acetyltransferase [Spirochaetaceae bacterium]